MTQKIKTNNPWPWAVYCKAALDINPKALPRYTYATKEEAEDDLPEIDRECASCAEHFIKNLNES